MTRPDEDLERVLQQWLKDTAPPLPRDVLAEVVSELPRTSRQRSRWSWPRAWGAVAATAALSVIVATGAVWVGWTFTTGGQSGSPATSSPGAPTSTATMTWDVVADYGRGSAYANPIGDRYGHADVWSYRFATTGTTDPFTHKLMTEFDPSIEKWSASGLENLHVYLDGASFLLHPYLAGSDSRAAIVDWASPIAGRVSLRGQFAHVQACQVPNDGVVTAIDVAGRTVWSERLQPQASASFDLEVDVQPGVVVSFRVDPANDSNCDSTDLTLAVTSR